MYSREEKGKRGNCRSVFRCVAKREKKSAEAQWRGKKEKGEKEIVFSIILPSI